MNKLNKVFVAIIFLLIMVTAGFAESQFDIIESQQDNEIQITTNSSGVIHVAYTCNFIPGWQKLYIKFSNGSLLGYFPKKEKSLIISAWNDKKYAFELLFCNALNGKVTILEQASGWDFHIFSSETEEAQWVAVVPQGNAKLFLIDNKGGISKQIFFDAEISPDVVRMEQRQTRTILILESLDYYCEYLVDFKQKTATKKN